MHHGPRASLVALRITAALMTVTTALQPVLAGMYLSGMFKALAWHGLINGHIVQLLSLIQLVVVAVYAGAGRGRWRALTMGTLIFLAANFQLGMGYARDLLIHIPLGVTVVTGQLLFTVWVFGPWARQARPPKRETAGAA